MAESDAPISSRVEHAGTLLLVDDEANILSSLRRLLRPDGYRILTAGGGQEGLEVLAREPIDVIVSDQRMPGMTGTEFLRLACQRCPDTIRIVLSGYTELESVTKAINEGSVYRFLTKPWDDELLRKHIAEAMHNKRMSDENRRLQQELGEANQRLSGLLEERQQRVVMGEASLNFAHELMASLPLAVVGIDNEGLIVLANDQAQHLFASALVGMPADLVLPPSLQSMVSADIDALPHEVVLGAGRLQVSCCSVGHADHPRGRLFVFIGQAAAEAT